MKKTATEGLVLGFDFGTKYIGVALGNTISKTANGLTSLTAQKGQINWHQLETIVDEWQPITLVVGLPLNMDGSDQPITGQARQFAKGLKTRFDLPVELVDERLTTLEAKARIFEEQGYRGLDKSSVDMASAAIILEQWLNASDNAP